MGSILRYRGLHGKRTGRSCLNWGSILRYESALLTTPATKKSITSGAVGPIKRVWNAATNVQVTNGDGSLHVTWDEPNNHENAESPMYYRVDWWGEGISPFSRADNLTERSYTITRTDEDGTTQETYVLTLAGAPDAPDDPRLGNAYGLQALTDSVRAALLAADTTGSAAVRRLRILRPGHNSLISPHPNPLPKGEGTICGSYAQPQDAAGLCTIVLLSTTICTQAHT